MAAWNRSRDVNSDPEHSGGTWRPPLPRLDNGDNVRPVPLWEREFCRNACDTPWETFCENKRFIGLYKNVMDWDDSGALKNFLDAKERFRAKYFGEPFEDPVLDPDMYIHEVDHHCEVDPGLVAAIDNIATLDLVADLGWGGMANMTPMSWGEPVPNLVPTGWGPTNVTPDAAWGGQVNQTQEAVGGAQPYCGDGGGIGSGSGSNRNGGGRGGGGSGSNWNCFGRSNQRNQNEGQHQHSHRYGGRMQRNQQEGQHQQRSGGRQQQGQSQGVRRMEWRPVQPQQGSQR